MLYARFILQPLGGPAIRNLLISIRRLRRSIPWLLQGRRIPYNGVFRRSFSTFFYKCKLASKRELGCSICISRKPAAMILHCCGFWDTTDSRKCDEARRTDPSGPNFGRHFCFLLIHRFNRIVSNRSASIKFDFLT